MTVSELTRRIRGTLSAMFQRVRVSGEVSNLSLPASGHVYFALKDRGSLLQCVLFRSVRVAHRDSLREGIQLVLEGEVTVYEQRGQYQLVVSAVEPAGTGALHLEFERLKEKLRLEGLFDQERKRPLPRYPFRVGLITSRDGAVIRDIENVSRRRNPALVFHLAHTRVQGEGTAGEIAAAIGRLNRFHLGEGRPLDAILIARGGGSLEQLWAFNEEELARAVAASELPVVSAVGHETDHTICDFVSDLRAPTPSAAAEILTQNVLDSSKAVMGSLRDMEERARRRLRHLAGLHPLPDATRRLAQAVRRVAQEQAETLRQRGLRLAGLHPRRVLQQRQQRMDDLERSMAGLLRRSLDARSHRLERLAGRLRAIDPSARIGARSERCRQLGQLVRERGRNRMERARSSVERLGASLRHLSHRNVLERGYSITRLEGSGRVLGETGALEAGDLLVTTLKEGRVWSRVERTSAS